jgi:hypothetical protein
VNPLVILLTAKRDLNDREFSALLALVSPPGNLFYKIASHGVIGHICTAYPTEPLYSFACIRDFIGNE